MHSCGTGQHARPLERPPCASRNQQRVLGVGSNLIALMRVMILTKVKAL